MKEVDQVIHDIERRRIQGGGKIVRPGHMAKGTLSRILEEEKELQSSRNNQSSGLMEQYKVDREELMGTKYFRTGRGEEDYEPFRLDSERGAMEMADARLQNFSPEPFSFNDIRIDVARFNKYQDTCESFAGDQKPN